MAFTYEQSASFMKDVAFVGRVKVSCLKFADYILAEAANTPGHTSRTKWAQNVVNNSESIANQITPIVVMDPQVQLDGGAISDVALQTAVETALNNKFL